MNDVTWLQVTCLKKRMMMVSFQAAAQQEPSVPGCGSDRHKLSSGTEWLDYWSGSSSDPMQQGGHVLVRVRTVQSKCLSRTGLIWWWFRAAAWKEPTSESWKRTNWTSILRFTIQDSDKNISATRRRTDLPLHSLTLFLLASLGADWPIRSSLS